MATFFLLNVQKNREREIEIDLETESDCHNLCRAYVYFHDLGDFDPREYLMNYLFFISQTHKLD